MRASAAAAPAYSCTGVLRVGLTTAVSTGPIVSTVQPGAPPARIRGSNPYIPALLLVGRDRCRRIRRRRAAIATVSPVLVGLQVVAPGTVVLGIPGRHCPFLAVRLPDHCPPGCLTCHGGRDRGRGGGRDGGGGRVGGGGRDGGGGRGVDGTTLGLGHRRRLIDRFARIAAGGCALLILLGCRNFLGDRGRGPLSHGLLPFRPGTSLGGCFCATVPPAGGGSGGSDRRGCGYGDGRGGGRGWGWGGCRRGVVFGNSLGVYSR